jgi:FkbM family methyltransferase
MNKISKKNLVKLTCKTSLQPVMKKMYLFALTSMNYGNANTLDHEATGEDWIWNYVKQALKEEQDLIVFDVGANIGSYSLLATEILGDRPFKIFAFEPAKAAYSMLAESTKSIPGITTFNFGLGEKPEDIKLYANYEGSGATTLYKEALENFAFNENIAEDICLKMLDKFCSAHAVDKIDFLKIDVEGHELPVLLGGIQMLQQKKIKFIQFEFGAFHVYSRTFFKDFWDLLSPSYKMYRIISDGIFEIKSYSETLEIFRTGNFFAELV